MIQPLTNLAERLLSDAALDQILGQVENAFHDTPHDPSTDDGREAITQAIFQVEVTIGLMRQVIEDRLAQYPSEYQSARQSLTKIAMRLGNVRTQLALLLPPMPDEPPVRDQLYRLALDALGDFVDSIQQADDMTVAVIDREIASLIHPRRQADWQEWAAEAEALRHRAVFELVRLRAKRATRDSFAMPSLRTRLSADRQARKGLIAFGLAHGEAERLVVAIRHRDIPHVAMID